MNLPTHLKFHLKQSLRVILFFVIMIFPIAAFACPPAGSESPHNPGCCYTGVSASGGCGVLSCSVTNLCRYETRDKFIDPAGGSNSPSRRAKSKQIMSHAGKLIEM